MVRNRVKRQIRALTRSHQWVPGYDVVIVAQPACAEARFDELASAIASTCEKLGILMGNRAS